jgi:hypothetical protein
VDERDELETTQAESGEQVDTVTPRGPSPDSAERPEADVAEQSQLVDEEQFVDRSTGHDRLHQTVDEADWLDQSLGENLEDDDRR